MKIERSEKEKKEGRTKNAKDYGLTDKQYAFCVEYMIDLNATQAAIRAGYSEKTANEQACRLLANVSISKCIEDMKDDRFSEAEITIDYILQNIISDRAAALAKGQTGVAMKANELLAKYRGMFTEKIQVVKPPTFILREPDRLPDEQ